MRGLMQAWPLTCNRILEHAERNHPWREVVTRTASGFVVRTTYAEIGRDARCISAALERRGVGLGDRVATLAWNTHEHLASWYGIFGIGAVYHTLNPRLFPEQLAWIANHAQDRIVFADAAFVPLLEGIQAELPAVEAFVIFSDAAHMPKTSLRGAVSYEALLAEGAGRPVEWGGFDENTACGLCYTSGTTGDPKGVLYSHRSNTLMALIGAGSTGLGIQPGDVILPVVPLFHANSWALAFIAPMIGAKLVLPGPRLDPASLCELIDGEKVTFSAAVPTVWQGLLQYLQASARRIPTLERVVIGGAACPPAMIRAFEEGFGVHVEHAWGMTEMSPIGTICQLLPEIAELPPEERLAMRAKQGRAPFGVELRIAAEDGTPVPHDGRSAGRLMARGPAVAAAYLHGAGGNILDEDGYFDTGDIATIDAHGYMQITDRAKDIVKSGGEWISSVGIECIVAGHPAVAHAAVIATAHEKWGERPLLIVQLKPEAEASDAELLEHLRPHVPSWWMPDGVARVEQMPLGATGKIDKKVLRRQYAQR